LSERAAAHAERFERAHQEIVATVANLSEADWVLLCPNENRTVAALAHHIADAYLFEIEAFRAMAERRAGEAFAWEGIHRANAEGAQTHECCDRAETIALLNANAARTVAIVRSFTNEQLEETGVYVEGLPCLTVAEWLDSILVGHVEGHLASIRAALADRRLATTSNATAATS
jgi:hypothetical protein